MCCGHIGILQMMNAGYRYSIRTGGDVCGEVGVNKPRIWNKNFIKN